MVQGRFKSNTFKQVKRVTPGGKTVTHYERRKPSKAVCGNCGKALSGVPRDFPKKIKNMAKTLKRPERPFGGVLCSKCSREEIISRIEKE